MRVCVFGLGHLGTITAACLAAQGHDVIALDPDADLVAALAAGRPEMEEPGLRELLAARPPVFTSDVGSAVGSADVIWLADDTPVGEDDAADVEWVLTRAETVLRQAAEGHLVLVSSQLPVGSVASLERSYPTLSFACVPENLRLGRAVESFQNPSRVVVGARQGHDQRIAELLEPFANRIIWMSVEAAELTKHALNAFLATSVVFANEIAAACEAAGADMREVEQGLRSDPRVGARAYVAAGPPFSGGTLARDLRYLEDLGRRTGSEPILLEAVLRSNRAHALWARRHLERLDPDVVAVWGLSYKPGTDSIRRSDSVALCEWLVGRGISVRAHDPAAQALPVELGRRLTRSASHLDAVEGADALVIAVAWPEYGLADASAVVSRMATPVVIDPSHVAAETLGRHPDVAYVAVGVPA